MGQIGAACCTSNYSNDDHTICYPSCAAGTSEVSTPMEAPTSFACDYKEQAERQKEEGFQGTVFRPPHLVLHFDINKTIIMVDSAKNQPISDVLNGILAECTWGQEVPSSGTTDAADGWRMISDVPSIARPESGAEKNMINYLEYLKMKHPGKEGKKQRESLYSTFTDSGRPGERARKVFDDMREKIVDNCGATDGPSTQRSILASFYYLLQDLLKRRRSFSVVFRTFGRDLTKIAEEFNEFCTGNHPKYLDVRLDGTDRSGIDFRIFPENIGSWYREDNRMAIIWGTLSVEEDLKASGVSIDELLAKPEYKNLRITDGMSNVYKELSLKTSRGTTVALRDFWPYWSKKGELGQFGKPLLIKPDDMERLDVFFDDCIHLGEDDTHIVDVRNAESNSPIMPEYARKHHLCRAEPLHAIQDKQFFLKRLQEKEKVFAEKVKAQGKVAKA